MWFDPFSLTKRNTPISTARCLSRSLNASQGVSLLARAALSRANAQCKRFEPPSLTCLRFFTISTRTSWKEAEGAPNTHTKGRLRWYQFGSRRDVCLGGLWRVVMNTPIIEEGSSFGLRSVVRGGREGVGWGKGGGGGWTTHCTRQG